MRYLQTYIQKDLEKKMVFLGGPRQCGKTTLAKRILLESKSGIYFNWDRPSDQKKILSEDWSDSEKLIIFDEVHKYSQWKSMVKGYYDSLKDKHHFLVSGSARLDVYRRGGDSLLGRYHYWRLHPFSLNELPEKIGRQEAFDRLMRVGAFPEPFLDNDEREARRWREERTSRILRDDIRDLENIKQIDKMGLLLEMLKGRVGSLISVNSLAEDLGVSQNTVAHWIEIFEKMYLIFLVRAFSKNIARALSKPFKVYFFDNADVEGDEGARFENLVACHLLKKNHFLQDYHGFKMELCFIRDKEKREVDFVLLKDGIITDLIEVKWAEKNVSAHLKYFAERLKVPRAIQLIAQTKDTWKKGNLYLARALDFFSEPIDKISSH